MNKSRIEEYRRVSIQDGRPERADDFRMAAGIELFESKQKGLLKYEEDSLFNKMKPILNII
jgi:hypothetical protein